MTDDEEIASLRAEYLGRWHFFRLPCQALVAAREPGRGYHIVATDAGELASHIARYEKEGSLV